MATGRNELDRPFMLRALKLAERGRGRTSPNPIVGAVVARGGRVVGEGWHRSLGEAHAERMALEAAGARARGATLYVTLEPCAHTGRTPPCADAVVRAGIARCVVAVRDPHPLVAGRGLRRLRRARVAVSVGLCGRLARRALRGYWLAHTESRPHVTWKVAATLDGKIADAAGTSRWITGPEARAHAHRMRALADAILIGAGTAREDDPRLTVRPARGSRQPLRVVCDTELDLPDRLRLFAPALARGTVVACGPKAPPGRRAALERRGVRVWRLPLAAGRVSPAALARRLVRAGCQDVLLEGGAALGTCWMRAGLVDRVALYVAPLVLGAEGLHWCGRLGLRRLPRARVGRLDVQARRGRDGFVLVDLGV